MALAQTTVYDPFSDAFQADPHLAYRELREHNPVHHHAEPRFWALSRFEDIWGAVRDNSAFSSENGLTFYPDEIGQLGLAPTIVMLDPPRHTRLRSLIAKGFTPQRVMSMEPLIRDFVRGRVDAITAKAEGGEQVDLHREFSSPIPTFVLAELFDLPAGEREQFNPWVRALTALQDGGFDLSALDAKEAVAQMFGYFSEIITARRANPGADMISVLTQAELDGEKLTDWDILGFCFVLVAGGNDTTGNLVSHGVMLLDGDHAQRDRLAAEPEFGPTAGELDITRKITRHLAFSSGVHFCIGSHLARLQGRIALEELLAKHPHVGVDLDNAVRLKSAFTRGWTTLPATGLTTR